MEDGVQGDEKGVQDEVEDGVYRVMRKGYRVRGEDEEGEEWRWRVRRR